MRDRPRNDIRAMLPLHLAALEYAHDMIGVKEDYVNGTWANWGPEVKEFLYAAGVHTPAPWCAAFVNWSAEEGAYDLGITSPLENVPLQAYVPSYVTWAEQNGLFVPANEVGPGDLFVLYYNSLKRYGHIGFVFEMREDAGMFTTIEGNTNDAAAREGYTVAEKERVLGDNTKFIRWA